MSYGVGHRHSSGPMLLWLWRRPAAAALIRPLAWEPPYAAGAALEKEKKNHFLWFLRTHLSGSGSGREGYVLLICKKPTEDHTDPTNKKFTNGINSLVKVFPNHFHLACRVF